MPSRQEIRDCKERYSEFSEEQLLEVKHQHVSTSAEHLVAVQLLHERQKALAEERHEKLLDEIKRPHWSVTPGFWVSLIAMVAACVAAYPVLVSWFQE